MTTIQNVIQVISTVFFSSIISNSSETRIQKGKDDLLMPISSTTMDSRLQQIDLIQWTISLQKLMSFEAIFDFFRLVKASFVLLPDFSSQ